jgi:aminoglycoside 6'-N-acetyltransferase
MGKLGAADEIPIRLRPASFADRLRIRRWLAQGEVGAVGASWGDRASAEAEISLAMSSQAALCRMVEDEAAAIGYGQAVETGLWAGPPVAGLAPGTWRIDLFLAPGTHTNGVDTRAVTLLVEEVFATTLAIACASLVPISNERAARAYERAQFRWQRITNDPRLGRCWLMLRQRPRP